MRSCVRIILLGLLVGSNAQAAKEPGMEIQNKGDPIYVRVKSSKEFVKVGAPEKVVNKIEQGETKPFEIDTAKDTELYIYRTEPNTESVEPFRVYSFARGKTIYVTWNGTSLYPQTGPGKGIFGKTNTGFTLKNNVKVDKKIQEVKDVTEARVIEHKAALKIDEAARATTTPVSLNDLWRTWCDPENLPAPERPDSLFCAAGMGNPFALLMLRLRFRLPVNEQDFFDPKSHMLKLIGEYLPKGVEGAAWSLSPQALFTGFFPKIDRAEVIEWRDFDLFVVPVKENKELAKFLNDVMSDYGLSSENTDPAPARVGVAKTNLLKAKKALGEKTIFPVTSMSAEDKSKMDLNALFDAKCRSGGKWSGSLFCGIGEGGIPATYFGQVRFVQPKKDKKNHAILLLLDSIQKYAEADAGGSRWDRTMQWMTGNIGLPAVKTQLKKAITSIDKNAGSMTWEDLRDALTVGTWFATKDLTEWVPYYGNGSLKAYGIEIAQ